MSKKKRHLFKTETLQKLSYVKVTFKVYSAGNWSVRIVSEENGVYLSVEFEMKFIYTTAIKITYYFKVFVIY